MKPHFHYLALSGALLPAAIASPTVDFKNGTVQGTSTNGIETFNGIPYAQPPVGSLRLRPPRSINASLGTIDGTGVPTACPQYLARTLNTSTIPPAAASIVENFFAASDNVGPTGEDCLTLNVVRPAGTNESSKLPVIFWFYGGAFSFGSTQMYSGNMFVKKSMDLGEPVIFVEANYRIGGFGFLPGREVQRDGATNLGLRDQRKSIEWVAENIAAFGGDSDKVTLWGESAGSVSSFDHTIIYSGDNMYNGKPLFRAVIMNSGSTQPCNTVTSSKSQNTFDTVAAAAGCSGAADVLQCLRELPYAKYLTAVNSVLGPFSYRGLDLPYIPKPDPASSFYPVSPEVAVERGNYVRIPTIIGDQEDEGPLFSLNQANISTTAQLNDYIATFFAPATYDQIAGLVATYPDDPAAGSPFRTGPLNNFYPQYKRLAALQGDSLFTLQRRIYLDHIAKTQPAWSYLSSYFYGTPILGTFHATDVLALFLGLAPPAVIDSILTYYVSFVNCLDPNTIPNPAKGQQSWPKYDLEGRTLLQFNADGNGLLKDDFRQASYKYLKKFQSALRFG